MFDQHLLRAAGALRHDYERVDWSTTPLGPVASWSPTLRNAVDAMLQVRFCSTLLWGPEFVLVYNQPYVELIQDKHPRALGRPCKEVFPEAWAVIGPMMESVRAGEGSTWVEDQPLPLIRNGRLEECFFTYSYSAVRAPDGTIEGVLDVAAETTGQVIGRRRLVLLTRLTAALADVERAEEVAARALPILRGERLDLPEVELHLADLPGADGGRPRLDGRDVLLEAGLGGTVARVPIDGRGSLLVARLSPNLAPDEEYLGYLRLIGSALEQALVRVTSREAERDLSEALQRSLLTPSVEPADLEVAVRYRPAAEKAQVGGDWYDSFVSPDGAVVVVVGDVAGHDQRAAAAMAQVRNLLRGIAYASDGSPAQTLSGLDRAMQGLDVQAHATALVGRVEQTAADAAAGRRVLRWANAGHLPPVLLQADGTARLLRSPAEVMLGIDELARTDHVVELHAGDVVVLFTDGLVERRGVPLPESLDWLVGVVAEGPAGSAEALADHVLGQLPDGVEDDVALLVLRVAPA